MSAETLKCDAAPDCARLPTLCMPHRGNDGVRGQASAASEASAGRTQMTQPVGLYDPPMLAYTHLSNAQNTLNKPLAFLWCNHPFATLQTEELRIAGLFLSLGRAVVFSPAILRSQHQSLFSFLILSNRQLEKKPTLSFFALFPCTFESSCIASVLNDGVRALDRVRAVPFTTNSHSDSAPYLFLPVRYYWLFSFWKSKKGVLSKLTLLVEVLLGAENI